jgi:Spy/CpxP family protein refolding chaperone
MKASAEAAVQGLCGPDGRAPSKQAYEAVARGPRRRASGRETKVMGRIRRMTMSGRASWPMAGILSGVLMLATGTASAEPPEHRGQGFVRFQQRLGLSEDQVRALHQAREQRWEARRQVRRSMMAARRSLNDLILQGADDTAVKAKTAEIQQLSTQALELRVKTMQDFARVLTPEQRARLLQRHQPPRSGLDLPVAG